MAGFRPILELESLAEEPCGMQLENGLLDRCKSKQAVRFVFNWRLESFFLSFFFGAGF